MFFKALNEIINSNTSTYRMRSLLNSEVGIVNYAQNSLFKS